MRAHAWLFSLFFKCLRTQRRFYDAQLWPVKLSAARAKQIQIERTVMRILSADCFLLLTQLVCRNTLVLQEQYWCCGRWWWRWNQLNPKRWRRWGGFLWGFFLVWFFFCLLLFVKENGKCLLLLRSVTTIWANIHTQCLVWWVSAHLFNLLRILLHVADAVHCAVRTFHITCHSRQTDSSFLFRLKKNNYQKRLFLNKK